MKRETIDMSKIPDFQNLICEDSIYDEDTDSCIYEGIESEIVYVDLEKCYKEVYVVFQRVSDGKYFAFNYNFSYNWDDDNIIATEVFPSEKTITVYS